MAIHLELYLKGQAVEEDFLNLGFRKARSGKGFIDYFWLTPENHRYKVEFHAEDKLKHLKVNLNDEEVDHIKRELPRAFANYVINKKKRKLVAERALFRKERGNADVKEFLSEYRLLLGMLNFSEGAPTQRIGFRIGYETTLPALDEITKLILKLERDFGGRTWDPYYGEFSLPHKKNLYDLIVDLKREDGKGVDPALTGQIKRIGPVWPQ